MPPDFLIERADRVLEAWTACPQRPFRNWLSGVQLIEQRLRLLQIARVEPLRKPPVNRSQQFARLPHLALVTPEAREAHGCAEFPRFCLLLARDCECALEVYFRPRHIQRRLQCELPLYPIYLGFPPAFLAGLHRDPRITDPK